MSQTLDPLNPYQLLAALERDPDFAAQFSAAVLATLPDTIRAAVREHYQDPDARQRLAEASDISEVRAALPRAFVEFMDASTGITPPAQA